MRARFIIGAALLILAAPASAELAQIRDEATFRQIVTGKTLTRPLIRLQVLPGGRITGTGAAREVAGSWTWRDGYFCRDLIWGGRNLGYNCQEVRAASGTIRFTSDRGKGDYADFRLRGN
ncbi:dihydrodipicolinate reductase [Ruegeria sediminis]|uniref:Dihydrodipicolinate reductase n=1 Tax=Ruegeria sediminis TaxID=2583820 RepID=A0ABY2WUB1_9RHOB|nr:dihydrodipicolinate reductase [Ruegeria sediminis]TMV04831.1 dihydrodipicolinate reductase [Ruegeria sediminis]